MKNLVVLDYFFYLFVINIKQKVMKKMFNYIPCEKKK